MDRPSRRPEPIEPNRHGDQSLIPPTRAEPPARDTSDASPYREARTPESAADPRDRTATDHSTAPTEPGENATGPARGDRQKDEADRPVARRTQDVAHFADERRRDAAEREATAEPYEDSTSTDRDVSDRLPANLREQMLRDPRFTRLGWGADEPSTTPDESSDPPDENVDLTPQHDLDEHEGSEEADVVTAGDTQEEPADSERLGDEVENSGASEPQTPTATVDGATLYSAIQDDPGTSDAAVDETSNEADGTEERPPAQHDVDIEQHTADGHTSRPADAEPTTQTDEAVTDQQVVDPTHDDLPEPATNAAIPTEQPEVSADGLPDAADGTSDDIHNGVQDREAADTPEPVTLDTQVNGESIRALLDRWDPERMHLPRPRQMDAREESEMSGSDGIESEDQRTVDERNAVAYIAASKEARPWLEPAAACDPVVQSIYASLDQGLGHAHMRHGPMGPEQIYANRVSRLEDPAQQDAEKRLRSVDGLDPAKMHYCGEFSTRIADPVAFAAVVVGASENRRVQDAIHAAWDDPLPDNVAIPISDLLGPNGHAYCSGFRLKDWPQSKPDRKQWALARARGDDLTGLQEPQAEPIPTFEGGEIIVTFKRNQGTKKVEINTIFAQPAEL